MIGFSNIFDVSEYLINTELTYCIPKLCLRAGQQRYLDSILKRSTSEVAVREVFLAEMQVGLETATT